MSSSNGEHQSISMNDDSLSDEQGSLVSSVPENKKKKKCSRKRIAFSVCLIIVALTLIIIYLYEKTHVFDDSITAILNGNSYQKRTCQDNEYGCCEIYNQCSPVEYGDSHYLDYKTDNINVYRIYSHDILDSNCPSLRELVNKYNQHYGKDDCGKFGCCPSVDVGCDSIVHYEKHNGGSSYLLKTYLENKTDIMEITVPKKDKGGMNCWDKRYLSFDDFIISYQDGYPDKNDNTDTIIIIIVFIILFMLGISSIKG